MGCVDESSETIVVGDHIRIKFTKDDIRTVFGIPSCGKRVLDNQISSRDAKDKVIHEYLGSKFKERRSIKVVQEIIDGAYSDQMSKQEEDAFRVAFVVFVVSTLLSPSAKHDYASVDYWNTLEDPSSISKYDWSEYVMTRLLDAVTKLKQDVSSSIKFPIITGCSLFLQVFPFFSTTFYSSRICTFGRFSYRYMFQFAQVLYLDSIDLGVLSMKHNSFPRIREFSYDRMREMIAAEQNNFARHEWGNDNTRHCKVPFNTILFYDFVHTIYSFVDISVSF